MHAAGLKARKAAYRVSGASRVDVYADKATEGDLSGASHADISGNPTIKQDKVSGASGVSYR